MVDFEELVVPATDEQLSIVAGLIKRQVEIEDWIVKADARLAEAKTNLAKVSLELLPAAMLAAGVQEFADDSGFRVKVKSDVKASITEANKEWCFKWLRDSNNGDIIRNEFKITYGVGEGDRAKELVTTLKDQKQEFNQKEYVHSRTLPAFCRTELEDPDKNHSEEWEKKFGIFRYKIAKIERPS